MSLCCKIGCRERSSSRNFSRGEPSPVPLRRPSRENPPRKVHKDPVTAEVCTL
ncbi:Hypothetical protein FKW44_025081 [Caligus rogercresseyi]|uniref:Uncharacterized protein n=1 Tax=Caligus rogercresseyi TaxID=217165 RepID=A0A7T8GJZ5_CALRO|nr:Hypothetical protein FKW44_025081 [Caligus rogercresseyi]